MALRNPWIRQTMSSSTFSGRWIYPHSLINLLGLFVFTYSSLYPYWLGLVGMSLTLLILDINKSIKVRDFQPFRFGYPNLITTGRLIGILGLCYTFHALSDLALFIAFTVLILLDGVDGLVARKLNQCSPEGEKLDTEVDAQLVWLLSWIHFYSGNVDWWILIPGSLRYTYQLLFFWVPSVSSFPPKRFRATIAVIFFFSLSLAFILEESIAKQLLFVASVLIVLSFGLSLIGGLKQHYDRKSAA
ncbi:MAG: CDP-alcohol phosphatidyltransferase family protein [Cytophagales bacterium]|nr:CDP-alcohol phosphatidyltransferase family protein [Cytophagales bacterium]